MSDAIVKVDVEVATAGDVEPTGHPPGYHKDEAARARCWGCSHPERLAPGPGDEELAKKLVAEGWLSTSNKFRTVSRVTCRRSPRP